MGTTPGARAGQKATGELGAVAQQNQSFLDGKTVGGLQNGLNRWFRPGGSTRVPLHGETAARQAKAGAMKSLTEHIWFETPHRRDYLNITGKVESLVRQSGVQEGLCLVNAMHITASVYINDAEDGLLHDYDVWLEKLAPHAPTSQYQHNRTGEDNADAHMKRQLMGREVVVAITKGKLDLGPWEQIFYGEFDGRRRKRVLVKIIGE
jgi:secondary thiamine-phosphate synthase enzyme